MLVRVLAERVSVQCMFVYSVCAYWDGVQCLCTSWVCMGMRFCITACQCVAIDRRPSIYGVAYVCACAYGSVYVYSVLVHHGYGWVGFVPLANGIPRILNTYIIIVIADRGRVLME